jgi:hypothetical protein
MAWYFPDDLMNLWDLVTFDMYQFGAGSFTGATASHATTTLISTRMNKLIDFFQDGTNTSGPTVSWMNYTVGQDLVFGMGEHASRPQQFNNWDLGSQAAAQAQANWSGLSGQGQQFTRLTAAKWARDAHDWFFNNPTVMPFLSWFNSSTGVSDERLNPNALGNVTNGPHPDFTVQTGDTETVMDVYREGLNGGISCKLSDIGL